MKDLLIFSQEQQNVFAKNLTEFLAGAKTQGWVMLGNNGNPVHRSRAGNPQVAFQKDDRRIYLRISTNLEAGIRAGEVKGLKNQPIYEIPITQGPSTGKTMLVIGVVSDSQLTPMTTIPDFNTLVIPGVEKVVA